MQHRTLDTLLVALLAAECGPLKCPVARLQHAVSRVEILLRDEFGFTETAKELGRLRAAIDPVESPKADIATFVEPMDGSDLLTGRKKRRQTAEAPR